MSYIETIVDNIEDQKCVLLLGYDIALNKESIPIHEHLHKYLAEKTDVNIDYEHDIDDLIVFKTRNSKNFFHTELKKYYKEHSTPNEMHKKIVRIPFHLVVSITPDKLLEQTCIESSIPYQFEFYNKKKNPESLKRPPSKNEVLIYNIFGAINDIDSLILTYEDLFEYLFAILGEKRLPRELRDALQEAKIFVFLGFDFRKWYLSLLFRLLNQDNKATPFASEKIDFIPEKVKSFLVNNFEMAFLEGNVENIINELYIECTKRSILREIRQEKENTIIVQVTQHIKNGNTETALDELTDYLDGKDENLFNEAIALGGRHNQLKRKMQKATISAENEKLEMAQITQSILELLKEVDV